MDLSKNDEWKFSHGFVKIKTWISRSFNIDLSKLICGFVKVVLYIPPPLPTITKLKFDRDLKACRRFCFELLKVLKESKYSMPWDRCAFGNVCSTE